MNEGKLSLSAPLSELPFIKGTEAAALASAHILTAEHLLRKAPKRHEDRRRFDSIPAQEDGSPLCLRVRVIDTRWQFQGRGRRYFEALVEESGKAGALMCSRLSCRWFHFPAISRMLATGMELIMYGRVKRFGKTLTLVHPEFEVVDPHADGFSVHLERIVPVYGKTGGLPQRRYREIVWNLLQFLPEQKDAGQGKKDDATGKAYPLPLALRHLHFPESMEEVSRARRRFSLEECFYMQLSVAWRKQRQQAQKGLSTAKSTQLLKELKESLPFELTDSQKECVREIYRDMKRPSPMNRLLQGDVGSGKTLVSVCAMLMAVEAGYQVALMAPTQILAEQHFKTCRALLDPLGIKIALKTGSKDEETCGWGPLSGAGEPEIIIGTHALLYKKTTFSRLGLVVIDEQHKFGVEQRERLISRGDSPDVLVMTATPIPRTLTLTLYGDLEVSLLREKPAGRGRIITALRTEKALPKVAAFVREQIDEGRQVYIVSPLVDEGDESRKRKGKSAVAEQEAWQKLLPHVDIALLHGRMTAEEKERVMKDFRANKYSVLVATTVVEVGVDVPNATIMIVNNADQFGLSQLHQLRGRVGRGELKSYCILLSSAKATDEGLEKLALFEKISDGFELSEADFRLRGPGDIFGTAQSGLSDIEFPDWLYDTRLIVEARQRAEALLAKDPGLTLPEHSHLRQRMTLDSQRINN